jgi:diaminopimelate epimerase
MKFAKYHALGNDYLVLEPSALDVEAAIELAPRLCHRNYGIGSDGILLGPFPSSVASAALRIINPDGSEAEKSGNGLRIFARYLWDTGRVTREPFDIETRGGLVSAKVSPEAGLIRVFMGQASFDSRVIGVTGPRRELVGEVMDFEGLQLTCSCVSVGNPHCVIAGVPVTEAYARSIGPRVETHARFEKRTNVQLLEPIDAQNIRIEIWERGAGYTLASGSSASAAACAAKRLGLCGGTVNVHMPGGTLLVEIEEDYRVTQTGPATSVATGEIDRECLSDGAAWTV